MLRSELPSPPICFSDVTRACLCACMFAPLDLYLCVSAVQTMREAITMGTAGLSYCGWLTISRLLISDEKKKRGRYAGETEAGGNL